VHPEVTERPFAKEASHLVRHRTDPELQRRAVLD